MIPWLDGTLLRFPHFLPLFYAISQSMISTEIKKLVNELAKASNLEGLVE
jgi:hypothetical protein